jgi:hypothetical protein
MSGYEQLVRLIQSYEALAAIQDAAADHLVTVAELSGWHDDQTQSVETLRHQARTSRHLAQEVRDGMTETA